MANLIQIKRSGNTAIPANTILSTGELAYSFAAGSNSLFIGGNDANVEAIRIGGTNYTWLHQANTDTPGALTANAVVITNGNSFVTAWKTNSLIVGADGTTNAITKIASFANTTQLGDSATASNSELVTSWSIKTYVDGQVSASIPVLTSTYVGFGNTSNYLGGVSSFTFDSNNNKLSVGNSTVNTSITPTLVQVANSTSTANITPISFATGVSTVNTTAVSVGSNVVVNASTLFIGNSSVNTTITAGNVVLQGSSLTVGNTSSITTVDRGDVTVTSSVTVGNSTVNTVISGANASFLGDASTIRIGNSTVNTVISSSQYVVTSDSANVFIGNTTSYVTANTGNLIVTGTSNTGYLYVAHDATIAGNLAITGTLTTVSANNLVVDDSLIQLAANNNATDVLDIGLYGNYEGDTAPHEHTGFFRDASDNGVWKLFEGLEPQPTTTVDTANASFTFATLQSFIKTGGSSLTGFIANSTVVNITANSSMSVAIAANTLSLSTALPGTSGGTGLSTVTDQDLLVANSSNGFNKLSAGSNGQVLQISAGVVAYGTLDGGTF